MPADDRVQYHWVGSNDAHAPRVSVVLATKASPVRLLGMIEALEQRFRSRNAELLVVRAGTQRQATALRKVTPGVRFVVKPMGTPISALLSAGARAATGDEILFLDDSRFS